jgi:crotonobetainyl-CoA:carnitine CoA-transferase CaiB-like acyl-CoA transferase
VPQPRGLTGPLAGLRVIDLSTVLAGPYATMVLADLGADVVKVEPPGGDATRGWGPPWIGDEAAGTRTAAYYLAVNRNKRSIRTDLRSERGREVVRRLLDRADVLVENFRPGSLAALGFDDGLIQARYPRLVHLAISGYGTRGPAAGRPGYDFVIQAVGGLMSVTGATDDEGGRPTKVGVAISDVVTGLFGVIGILGALLEREGPPEPGRGQRVDVSLLGATLAVLVNQAQNAFVTGRSPVRLSNAHPNIVPYETFATADGEIALAVGSERQWPRLCEALGVPGIAVDPRFAMNGDRVVHRDELRPLLADRFVERPTAEWLVVLERADIPVGPVRSVAEAFDAEEARALDTLVEVEHPAFGVLRQAGIPIRFGRTPGSIRTSPPLLGEHAREILSEIGYDPAEIDDLRASGVI